MMIADRGTNLSVNNNIRMCALALGALNLLIREELLKMANANSPNGNA
jgi:hypothetical protein